MNIITNRTKSTYHRWELSQARFQSSSSSNMIRNFISAELPSVLSQRCFVPFRVMFVPCRFFISCLNAVRLQMDSVIKLLYKKVIKEM